MEPGLRYARGMADEKPSFVREMEEVAYLAVYRALPQMEETNAGEVSCKVKLTHKSGKRYEASITVCELDKDGKPNV